LFSRLIDGGHPALVCRAEARDCCLAGSVGGIETFGAGEGRAQAVDIDGF